MKTTQIIDRHLLGAVVKSAVESPRLRKNYNFHPTDSDASHRLLNAMEQDSYIQPHCHADASKDETIIVLQGKLAVVFFDPDGTVSSHAVLEPGGNAVGVNIPHGVFHTVLALVPGTVFFESKAGPYAALTSLEKANWAPPENDSQANRYHAELKRLFQDQQ